MKIALSTDTSCTISPSLAKKLNIFVFPLNVIVNGEEFLDGVSINQDDLKIAMRGNKIIKTSTPPPNDIIKYFEDIFAQGYETIIHFTISSKLSSMNTLFNQISHDNFNDKVIVIDSYSVCSLMLSHVLYAYDELQKGSDPLTIKENFEKRKLDNYVCFIPENLTALKNGGRISPAIANLGNLIGLKPIILLKDGALEKDSMTRNIKKGFMDNIKSAYGKYPLDKYDFTLIAFDANENLLNQLKSYISELIPGFKLDTLPIAINVCAHCGPGTIGFIVSPRINEKSLYDFL